MLRYDDLEMGNFGGFPQPGSAVCFKQFMEANQFSWHDSDGFAADFISDPEDAVVLLSGLC